MNEFGQVVAINGDMAQVKFVRSSACGKCHACGMTHDQKEIIISVENTKNAEVDEMVNIQIDSKKALYSSFVVYVVPLIMLILGVWLGTILGKNGFIMKDADMMGALTGLVFTALAFFGIKALEPFFKKKVKSTYKMI
jgi:sigma-E factor negative regulatory protein RseC